MNADELVELVEQRHHTLCELLEVSQRQIEAIAENRMSDLMRILSDKQQPIARLAEIAAQLAPAASDDPQARHWASESLREHCRAQQRRCDQMHQELLAIEADCQARLEKDRLLAEENLRRFDSGRLAATRYAESQGVRPSGGRLDLSSD